MSTRSKHDGAGLLQRDRGARMTPETDPVARYRSTRRGVLRLALTATGSVSLGACLPLSTGFPVEPGFTREVSWDEEVLLSDGRMIVVKQWREREQRYNGSYIGTLAKKASITFPALDGSKGEPVRYEGLIQPLILNVWAGRTYLVGQPLQHAFFVDMGAPRSGWLALVLNSQRGWDRISPRDVPERIRETNLLIAGAPPASMTRVMWATKISNELNANLKWPDDMRRLDPSTKSGWAQGRADSQLRND